MYTLGYRYPFAKPEAEICVAQFVSVRPTQEIRYFRMKRGELFAEEEYFAEDAVEADARTRYYSLDEGARDLEVNVPQLYSLDEPLDRELQFVLQRDLGIKDAMSLELGSRSATEIKESAPEETETWTLQNALWRVQQRASLHERVSLQRAFSENLSFGATPRSARSMKGHHTPRSARSLDVRSHSSPRLASLIPHDQFLRIPELKDPSSPRSVCSDSCLSVQFMGGLERALIRSDSESSIVSMSGLTKTLHPPSSRSIDSERQRMSYLESRNSFTREAVAPRAMTPEPPRHNAITPEPHRRKPKAKAKARDTRDSDSASKFSSSDSVGYSSFNDSRSSSGSRTAKFIAMPPSVGNVLTWNRPRPGGALDCCENKETPENRKPSPKLTVANTGRTPDKLRSPDKATMSSRASVSSMRSSWSRDTTLSSRSSNDTQSPEALRRKSGSAVANARATQASSPTRRPPLATRGSPQLPIKRPEKMSSKP